MDRYRLILLIHAFLTALLLSCGLVSPEPSPVSVHVPLAPKDATLVPELQVADSLVQSRSYGDARTILVRYLDSPDTDGYLRNRAINMYCYASIRDTAVMMKDTALAMLRTLQLTGKMTDALILAQRGVNLGYFHLPDDQDSAHHYFTLALDLLNAYYPADHPEMQKYYRDIGSYLWFDANEWRKALELFTFESELHHRWRYPPRDRFLHAYNLGVVHRSLEEYALAEQFQSQRSVAAAWILRT
jgi:hypothetical protein